MGHDTQHTFIHSLFRPSTSGTEVSKRCEEGRKGESMGTRLICFAEEIRIMIGITNRIYHHRIERQIRKEVRNLVWACKAWNTYTLFNLISTSQRKVYEEKVKFMTCKLVKGRRRNSRKLKWCQINSRTFTAFRWVGVVCVMKSYENCEPVTVMPKKGHGVL